MHGYYYPRKYTRTSLVHADPIFFNMRFPSKQPCCQWVLSPLAMTIKLLYVTYYYHRNRSYENFGKCKTCGTVEKTQKSQVAPRVLRQNTKWI